MKRIIKIVLMIFILLIVAGGGFLLYLNYDLNKVEKIDINNIDLTSMEDGIYTGIYNTGRFRNKIEVRVKENKIVEINIIENVTFALPDVADELFSKIKKKQKINIDVVSGATVTSKAYLKAVENALSENEV